MGKDVVETYKFRNFIDFLDKNTPKNNYSRNYEPDNFFCNTTWDESIKLAKYGINNQSKISKIVNSMNMLELVKTKDYKLAENGLYVDIGTYLSGEPECWISECYTNKPKKTVKILIHVACTGGVNFKAIENRGAGIVSLIQMLKKQGYIVKINIYDGTEVSGVKYTYFLNIPSNPLDLQSLTYAISDASLPRRFTFAWLEKIFNTDSLHFCGYGQPCSINQEHISKDIIHFSGINSESCNYNDIESTKQYIHDIFVQFLKLNNEKT